MSMHARDKLLRSLRFPSWNARHRQLEHHARRSFSGICEQLFNDATDAEWHSFARWLRFGQGVYWINGEEGSGKTTLIDHVVRSEQTLSALRDWQPGTPLILSYYFWAKGDAMQRCPKGMLCALLYQVVWSSEGALTFLLMRPGTEHKCNVDDWSVPELIAALKDTLILHRQPVCIFLDGLDECDQNENSQRELLDIISQLLELHQVKVCISSRLESTYDTEFATCPSLSMRDLNKRNVEVIAEQLLKENFTADQYIPPGIIERIEQKAGGVFLWVHLVMTHVFRTLQPDNWDQLRLKLETLPSSLTRLYAHIWSHANEVSESNLEEASLYFETLVALGDYTNLTTFTAAVDITIRQLCLAQRQRMTAADFAVSCKRIEQRLASLCIGLVEVRSTEEDEDWLQRAAWYKGGDPHEYPHWYRHRTVTFIHPTARHFLAEANPGQLLAHDPKFTQQQAQTSAVEGILATAVQYDVKRSLHLMPLLSKIAEFTNVAEQVRMVSCTEQILTWSCQNGVDAPQSDDALAITLKKEGGWKYGLLYATLKDSLGFHAHVHDRRVCSYITHILTRPKKVQQHYLDAMLTITLGNLHWSISFYEERGIYMLVEFAKLGKLLLEKGATPIVEYLKQYTPVERAEPLVNFMFRFNKDRFDKELTICQFLVPAIINKLVEFDTKLQHQIVVSVEMDLTEDDNSDGKRKFRCYYRSPSRVKTFGGGPSRAGDLLVEVNLAAFLPIALAQAGMTEHAASVVTSIKIAPSMNVFGVVRAPEVAGRPFPPCRCRAVAVEDASVLLTSFERLLQSQISTRNVLQEGENMIGCIEEVYDRSVDVELTELMIAKGFWRREQRVDGDIPFIKPFSD